MTNQKKISVIIPTYQRPEQLKRAMISVKSQNYENYEVIVCSDGYSAEDEELVSSMNDNRFTYNFIEKAQVKNWGHMQRNAMIEKCTGDYVMWLDDDNFIFNDYFSFVNSKFEDDYGLLVFRVNHNLAGIIPKSDSIKLADIDTLNVMVKTSIAKKIKWQLLYDADFYFIHDVENYCIENDLKIKFFDKIIGMHT